MPGATNDRRADGYDRKCFRLEQERAGRTVYSVCEPYRALRQVNRRHCFAEIGHSQSRFIANVRDQVTEHVARTPMVMIGADSGMRVDNGAVHCPEGLVRSAVMMTMGALRHRRLPSERRRKNRRQEDSEQKRGNFFRGP
ncbi:MAG: hypothetical protein IPH30_08610 [Betaproteobacteria bacterium]|nr:hypothetical protein [Betaproteobacteria bacterium]